MSPFFVIYSPSNMTYAISLNPVIPVRAEAKEQSEMITQLLFGDSCCILSEQDSFAYIKNDFDGYTGWVSKKMLTEISTNEYERLNSGPVFRTCIPIADAFCKTDKSIYHLSAGSRIPFYDPETGNFEIGNKVFQIHPSFISYLSESNKNNIISAAMLFLNTPYLWGGKNIFGIDCSGFVQTVFALNGYQLSRDSNTQAKEGISVNQLNVAEEKDLLFFGKDNKITHVGIYLGDKKIIHASGKVKIEQVDNTGIINNETSDYSHFLSAIRRI